MPKSITHQIPNALSVFRVTLTVAIWVLLFVPHELWVVQLLVAVGVVSDKLDGSIARWIGAVSDTGKRLESVADPFFSFTTIVYSTVVLDFDTRIFWLGTILLVIATAGRLLYTAKKGKMFYRKSQVTRVAVGLVYLVMLMYVFQLPYRYEVAWTVVLVNLIAYVNYLRLIWTAIEEKPST